MFLRPCQSAHLLAIPIESGASPCSAAFRNDVLVTLGRLVSRLTESVRPRAARRDRRVDLAEEGTLEEAIAFVNWLWQFGIASTMPVRTRGRMGDWRAAVARVFTNTICGGQQGLTSQRRTLALAVLLLLVERGVALLSASAPGQPAAGGAWPKGAHVVDGKVPGGRRAGRLPSRQFSKSCLHSTGRATSALTATVEVTRDDIRMLVQCLDDPFEVCVVHGGSLCTRIRWINSNLSFSRSPPT